MPAPRLRSLQGSFSRLLIGAPCRSDETSGPLIVNNIAIFSRIIRLCLLQLGNTCLIFLAECRSRPTNLWTDMRHCRAIRTPKRRTWYLRGGLKVVTAYIGATTIEVLSMLAYRLPTTYRQSLASRSLAFKSKTASASTCNPFSFGSFDLVLCCLANSGGTQCWFIINAMPPAAGASFSSSSPWFD